MVGAFSYTEQDTHCRDSMYGTVTCSYVTNLCIYLLIPVQRVDDIHGIVSLAR